MCCVFFLPLVEKGDLGQEVQRAAAGCAVIFGAGRKRSEWAQHKGATSSGVSGTVRRHSAGMLGVKSVVDGIQTLLCPFSFRLILNLVLKSLVVL